MGDPPPMLAYWSLIFWVRKRVITFAKIRWKGPRGIKSPSDCDEDNVSSHSERITIDLGEVSYEKSSKEMRYFILVDGSSHVHENDRGRSIFVDSVTFSIVVELFAFVSRASSRNRAPLRVTKRGRKAAESINAPKTF